MKLLLAALALVVPYLAHAATLDVMAGAAVFRGTTPAAVLDLRFPSALADLGTLAVGVAVVGESNWDCPATVTDCNENQAILYAQLLLPAVRGLQLGIGLAQLQHADHYNSGAINFTLSVEHTLWRQLFCRYQHFSNAGTHLPNEGRDLLLLGWRFS